MNHQKIIEKLEKAKNETEELLESVSNELDRWKADKYMEETGFRPGVRVYDNSGNEFKRLWEIISVRNWSYNGRDHIELIANSVIQSTRKLGKTEQRIYAYDLVLAPPFFQKDYKKK